MNKPIAILLTLFALLTLSFTDTGQKRLAKVATNDDYNFIDINRIKMWVANNGDGSHDPFTDGNGFFWPKLDTLFTDRQGNKSYYTTSAIFEDGLLWGCKIGKDIRVNGSVYRHGLQAGKILANGLADDPAKTKYRVYKVHRYWRDMQPGPMRDFYQKDHDEWPADDGAPWMDVDKDGIYNPQIDHPDFTGDEMLWYVSNDLDELRSTYTYGSRPIGLEIQTTVFGFDHPGALGDMVFKKHRFINRSGQRLDSLYFSYWSDPDLGTADDDFVGCDTTFEIAYCYNGTEIDGRYGSQPPAVGYVLLDHQETGMTTFVVFIGSSTTFSDPKQGYFDGTLQFYNYMKGRLWNGNPIINRLTGDTTMLVVPGDPVLGTGWYEGREGWPGGPDPSDRRMSMSSGPYQLAPEDTFDISFALVIQRGQDRLDSITELRKAAEKAHQLYNNNFQLPAFDQSPDLNSVSDDRSVTLYWDNTLDEKQIEDFLSDSYYNFEGYRLWQYSDKYGSDPQLLTTFDLDNDLSKIIDFVFVNGYQEEQLILDTPDEGLQYSYQVSENIYDNKPLNNGSPYYFGITAYAYSENSIPRVLESKPHILTVIPGEKRIDRQYASKTQERVEGMSINNNSDGHFYLHVIDPDAINGHIYKAHVSGKEDSLFWTLTDSTTRDTLISRDEMFDNDPSKNLIFNGLKFTLHDQGKDSISAVRGDKKFAVKSVMQISDEQGKLDQPIDILRNLSADKKWKVTTYDNNWSYDETDNRQNINPPVSDAIGYDYYEIRFTTLEEGSEYYLYGYTGSFRGPTSDDPKAKNKVPFQIWNIGRTIDNHADDYRLKVKTEDAIFIQDEDSSRYITDGFWTQSNSGRWEAIYAFIEPDSVYHDNLPESSGLGKSSWNKLHNIVIDGGLPEPGTIIRIYTWKPLQPGDVFVDQPLPADNRDFFGAKNRLDEITVFPNPYFGSVYRNGQPGQGFMRFGNLPSKVTVRIYNLAGVFVTKLEKDNTSPWLDWDLKNVDGKNVASGIYIAHLDMPHIGKKIIKLALVNDN